MKIFQLIFFLFFLLFSFFSGFTRVSISSYSQPIHSIEESFQFYLDSTNSLSLDQIQKKQNLFKPFSKKFQILQSNITYWIKIPIKNESSNSIHWVINFYDPDFNQIEFYDQNIAYKSGINFPFESKVLKHKNFVYPIQLNPLEEKTFWVKLQSKSGSNIKASLTDYNSYQNYALTEYYTLGIYYGILLMLMLYNLVLYFHSNIKTYLFYVLYIFAAILYSFNEDGLGFQFFWSNWPFVNKFLHLFSPLILQIGFTLFAISFLNLWKVSKVLFQTSFLISLAFIIHIFQINHFLKVELSFLIYLLPFILLLFFTINTLQNKRSESIYFLIGIALIISSLIVYFLRLLNWINSEIFEVYIFNFAIILESIVLSMAVGNKIKNGIKEKQIMQATLIIALKEKEILSQKVNKELNEKVKQRTIELEDQKKLLEKNNLELLSLKDKLYKMNEVLDLNNHNLKKEVQAATRQKILNKEISYSEFKELYKEPIHCLYYLKQLKLEIQFECPACKSKEFKPKNKHNRQCIKCKKIDSPTSNTIFHSLKFPLDKAFYLVYITNYHKNKYTLDQLSELLEIGRNTCWSFMKKVQDKKNTLSKGKESVQISFDELVM